MTKRSPNPPSSAPAGPSGAAAGRRRLTIASLSLLLSGLLAASAPAHHGQPATGETEPGEVGGGLGNETGTPLSTDTELTPVAKDGEQAGWKQIAGSKWQDDGGITRMASPSPGQASPTPYDLDFFGLDFLDKANGFAAGAQCRRDDPSQPVPPEEVAGCERIPVIYRYHDDPERGLIWEESYRGDDATDEGGYIAAVTWLGPGHALAVGGTGTYPRRESERPPGESDSDYAKRDEQCWDVGRGPKPGQCEGAGMARAWLYENGAWRELTDLPAKMRALQAIDASPRTKDCGPTITKECAIAGGMRQLWHFADGRFTRGYGPELNGGAGMQNPSNFRFRVRDIRFAPNWRSGAGGIKPRTANDPLATYAIAVTSGCCSQDRSGDRPALLSLVPSGWDAQLGGNVLGTGENLVDQIVQIVKNQDKNQAVDQAVGGRGVFNPDSYYALTVFRQQAFGDVDPPDLLRAAALRTPGGPSERYVPREPPSRFTLRCDSESCAINRTARPLGLFVPAEGTTLSSLRLVSADGDSRGFRVGAAAGAVADGIADWAVGVLRSTGEGVAYSTAFGANRQSGSYFANPKQCAGGEELVSDQGYCSFEAYQRKNASRALYVLPSYALNAYRVAGEDVLTGDEGIGWAVGDHGAILTRGGGVAGLEAPPARRGAKSPPQALSRDVFDEHRPPVTEEPGPVPALAPSTILTEPGFTEGQNPYGPLFAPPANLIVMSRDGQEGWALTRNDQTTFYHYDGLRWAPCDPKGVPNLIPPDPACAEAPAANAVSRVPLERDSDPTNDDEFEAVAVTSNDGLYRYDGKRWSKDGDAKVDGAPVSGQDVAFTAPDDGWVVRNRDPGVLFAGPQLLHFDGESWVDCTPASGSAPEACGDPDGRLRFRGLCPSQGQVVGLAETGGRVYLMATRAARERLGSVNPCALSAETREPYPLIIHRDSGGTWRGGTDTTDDGVYNPTDGGWDPGCASRDTAGNCAATGRAADQGRINSLSVAQDADGSFQGWAVGAFGGTNSEGADAVVMRLEEGGWRQWMVPDAANDYLRYPRVSVGFDQQLTLPSEAGRRNAFLFVQGRISTAVRGFLNEGRVPALAFDQARGRWAAIPAPWPVSPPNKALERIAGDVRGIGPDGRGGFWAAVSGGGSGSGRQLLSFHHYTDRAPAPVFSETPDPTAGRPGSPGSAPAPTGRCGSATSEAPSTATTASPGGRAGCGSPSGTPASPPGRPR